MSEMGIKYLSQKIKVGETFKAPHWDFSVTVAAIQEVNFTIEDSIVDEVKVTFKDTDGKTHQVSTDWSDATQRYTLGIV